MPETITALTLTDAERQAILTYWATPGEFVEWQRQALADEIERRAGIAGQDAARAAVEMAVAEAKDTFPTLFPEEPVAP